MHMTNNHSEGAEGFRLGPESRVVLHRHCGRYVVAVVVDEGPYSRAEAEGVADALREACGGWVTKSAAAHRLGLSTQMVDVLRRNGTLVSRTDAAGHALICVKSLGEELRRRAA